MLAWPAAVFPVPFLRGSAALLPFPPPWPLSSSFPHFQLHFLLVSSHPISDDRTIICSPVVKALCAPVSSATSLFGYGKSSFEVVGLAQVGPTEKTSGLPAFHPLQLQAPGGVDL